MDSKQREALAERVLGLSTADQTEVTIGTESADLTRFTHEEIHQNVARSDAGVSVRAILGLRTGTAATIFRVKYLRFTISIAQPDDTTSLGAARSLCASLNISPKARRVNRKGQALCTRVLSQLRPSTGDEHLINRPRRLPYAVGEQSIKMP